MEEYRVGIMTQGDTVIATIYNIPANREIAEQLKMTMDVFSPPVWQVRDTGEDLYIYYEAESDTCKFPVYKMATGEIYKAAIKDIKKAAKRSAA